MHVRYWKSDTGADMNSKYWVHQVGDLAKATVLKVLVTWSFTSFVLAVCLV